MGFKKPDDSSQHSETIGPVGAGPHTDTPLRRLGSRVHGNFHSSIVLERQSVAVVFLVEGFQVVGKIPPSGIHRVTEDSEWTGQELRADLLGTNTVEYVDQLEKNLRTDLNAEYILEATIEELELNLARRLDTREEVDAIFGPGMWKPLSEAPHLPR